MGGRSGWEGFGFAFGPRAWGFRGRGPRSWRRQWFGAGDMKYVILKLLRDKPRHGYEVMKELEERMHGCYSPSPGTVYPTLQWLEDEGLVVARPGGGQKGYQDNHTRTALFYQAQDKLPDNFSSLTATLA